ncbi:MAG: hypothetical protein ACI8QC_001057 [Planctomycetota bacterium]|jgi:hypothetical protein
MKLTHFALVCVSLGACQSTDPGSNFAGDGVDNAWDYLSGKYDRDGDGVVTEAEYTREAGDYAKLDRNEDGIVNAEDYPRGEGPSMGRGWNDIPDAMKRSMGSKYAARAVLLTYLQPDPTAEGLHRDDFLRMFAQLDSDSSQDIDESEFACATDARPWGGPGKAWPLMLAATDAPGNGDRRIGADELSSYFEGFANEAGYARGAPSGRSNQGASAMASDGAPAGHMAPDFELSPLGGGELVRLSDFREISPVALIFGSYT